MLSLKRGLRYTNIVRNTKSPFIENVVNRFFVARQFSGVKPNEIIISEVKNMATIAVKWYDESDLEHQIEFLKKLRDLEPIQRKENIQNFKQERSRLSSMWLGNWICKASTDKNFKLFPLSVPMEDKDLTDGIRNDLAATIFSIKSIQNSTSTNQIILTSDITKQWHSEAIELSNQLADNININRLRKVGTVFQDYVDEQIPLTVLYKELLEVTGNYANELYPILKYTELNITSDIELQLNNSISQRNYIQTVLTDELSHIIHIINSKLFFGNDSPIPDLSIINDNIINTPKTSKKETTAINNKDSKLEDSELSIKTDKKSKKLRKTKKETTIITPLKTEKENIKEAVLEVTDTSLIYTRKLNNYQLKLKYDDNKNLKKQLYIFDATASCYRIGTNNIDFNDEKERNEDDEEQQQQPPLEEYETYNSTNTTNTTTSTTSNTTTIDTTPVPQYKVMIENLPHNITEYQLRMALRKCGEVDRVWIYRDERTTPGDIKHLLRLRRYSNNKANSSKGRSSSIDSVSEEDESIGGRYNIYIYI